MLLAILLTLIQPAWGASGDLKGILQSRISCTPVDLTVPGGVMHQAPVRDQGELENCYGHVAAALLDAQNLKRLKKISPLASLTHRVSPLMVSLNYAQWKYALPARGQPENDFLLAGLRVGKVCGAVTASLGESCADEAVSMLFKEAKNQKKWITYLENIRSLSLKSFGPPLLSEGEWVRNVIESQQAQCPGFSESKWIDPWNVAQSMTEENEAAFIQSFIESFCEASEKVKLPPSSCSLNPVNSAAEARQVIETQLINQNSQPVGFAFCNRILRGDPPSGICKTPHAAVIAGRKEIDGKCKYLINNSWGKDCSVYSKKYVSCDPASGMIWVDADALEKEVIEVYQLGD